MEHILGYGTSSDNESEDDEVGLNKLNNTYSIQSQSVPNSDFFSLINENDEDELFEKDVEKQVKFIQSNLQLAEQTWELRDSEVGPISAVPHHQPKEYHSSLSQKRLNLFSNDAKKSKKQKCDINKADESLVSSPHPHIKATAPTKKFGQPSSHVHILSAHAKAITSLRWNIDTHQDSLLLSSSLDGTVKIWNMYLKKCINSFKLGEIGLKAAVWTSQGRSILAGGFNSLLHLIDAETGKVIADRKHNSGVTSIAIHPEQDSIVVTGTKETAIAWDLRNAPDKPVQKYVTKFGQVLDVAFLNESEFICSTDCVSRECADRSIMAWDFRSGALLSNQIYQERYTCPFLRVEPEGKRFLAQSHGGYIAIFSARRPYKMDKRKCYRGHKLSGYGIQFDINCDGHYVASGDASGSVFYYNAATTQLLGEVKMFTSPSLCVQYHPLNRHCLAAGSWNGELAFINKLHSFSNHCQ